MPTKELREGDFKVRIIKAELGESYSGKERIELKFEAPDGATATRHLYLSPRALPYTNETLESFGFNTEDPNYIDNIASLVGRGCKVRVMKPAGINATPEVVSVWPLDEDRPKPSQDELRARIKKKLAEPSIEKSDPEPDSEWSEKEKVARKPKPPVTPPSPSAKPSLFPPPPPVPADPEFDAMLDEMEKMEKK